MEMKNRVEYINDFLAGNPVNSTFGNYYIIRNSNVKLLLKTRQVDGSVSEVHIVAAKVGDLPFVQWGLTRRHGALGIPPFMKNVSTDLTQLETLESRGNKTLINSPMGTALLNLINYKYVHVKQKLSSIEEFEESLASREFVGEYEVIRNQEPPKTFDAEGFKDKVISSIKGCVNAHDFCTTLYALKESLTDHLMVTTKVFPVGKTEVYSVNDVLSDRICYFRGLLKVASEEVVIDSYGDWVLLKTSGIERGDLK